MAIKSFINEVEFLTQYPMVAIAISDSTGPVPGYLFGEINAITYVDNGNNCRMLVDTLMNKLNSSCPVVCIKVLKLLTYLVKNGHSNIIEELKVHEVHLKEARGFNGPADDVYGNSFYQMIRTMAKELLELIFSESIETSDKVSVADHVPLTGYGSQANLKKMAGFGYSVKTEKSVSDVVSDSFSSFVEKLFPSPDKETEPNAMSHIGDSLPKYKPIIIEKAEPAPVEESTCHSLPVAVPRPQKKKEKVHRPGRAGGGWESSSEDEEEEEEEHSSPPLIIELDKENTVSVESLESSKSLLECISEVSEECKIVDEFAVNKPLNELKYAEIQQICRRCSSLNCEEILSFILKKLSKKEEYIQMRALIFIEYLVFHDVIVLETVVKIVLPHLQKFQEDAKEMTDSVKIKTVKICKTIEILNKKLQEKFPQHESVYSEGTSLKC